MRRWRAERRPPRRPGARGLGALGALAAWALAAIATSGAGCGGDAGTDRVRPRRPEVDTAPAAAPSAEPDAPEEAPFGSRSRVSPAERALQNQQLVAEVLLGVSATRGLVATKGVKSRTLSREELLAQILSKQEQGAPKEVMRLTGESLAALELAPVEYDFEAGVYALLQEQIAGLYDPEEETMFLLDDLSTSVTEQTLAHELVHALQDQAFGLRGALDWKPRSGDRTAAFQSLVEGDATVAMLAYSSGNVDGIDEGSMRRIISMGAAMSAPDSPPVLVRSLVAPYTDGFAFVQALRRRGGWPAVDAAVRRRPASTEQVLHPDKFDAGEVPVEVPDPPLEPLGEGYRMGFVDVMGEQGARTIFEDWTHRTHARDVAAGWGGDAYAVATRPAKDGGVEVALAWHQRADSAADAKEIADLFASRFGKVCVVRDRLGPITWVAKGKDVALVAGPFTRKADRTVASTGTCATATAWAKAMIAPPAKR